MHCKQCDYPLWNLAARQCPECGAPFKPSEFEFVPDSVRFRCPHCRQTYFGRADKGHLEPIEFDCIDCGRHINMDEMILEPAGHVTEKQTRPGVMPWFERAHRGRVKAFFQTIGMAMTKPTTLIRGVPVESSVGAALVYALQTTLILIGIGTLIPGVIWLLAYYGVGGLWSTGGGFMWIGMLFWLLPYWILLPFGVLGLIVFWPMITHLALRWTGGCTHPIDRTFQAFAYSAGANALTMIPCFGILIGWAWWIVSATLMVAAGQKVSGPRAMCAVLVLPVLLAVAGGGMFGVGMWAETQMMNAAMVGAVSAGGTTVQNSAAINQALLSQSMQGAGGATTHVIEAMLGPQSYAFYNGWTNAGSTGSTLCSPGSKTTDADISVGDGTLADFLNAPSRERITMAGRLLDSLPDDLVAYRFGDYIFISQSAAASTWDAQRWTLVMLPDPDVNGVPGPTDPIHIGTADYNVIEITYAELAAELDAQNQHRASLGLPTLPDLLTITHDNPATGGDGESEQDDGG